MTDSFLLANKIAISLSVGFLQIFAGMYNLGRSFNTGHFKTKRSTFNI